MGEGAKDAQALPTLPTLPTLRTLPPLPRMLRSFTCAGPNPSPEHAPPEHP